MSPPLGRHPFTVSYHAAIDVRSGIPEAFGESRRECRLGAQHADTPYCDARITSPPLVTRSG
ncbi:hypothetical protein GCM10022223_01150 [Kineosporia mesophila]|uniref:Uncharacterized protein n=1 Tax=Kineosporia mesophila TaxID=566012 RepID=A0ABP6YTR7_9ACTN